jgi:RNA polymerase sigma factor (sigma-70 family)
MELSDGALWTRVRTGDKAAFALLFERHAKAIYNYCFRRLGNWSAAEDALSLVFLEAWRRRDQRLPPEKVLPWLYGIATNVVRNRRRRDRRAAALARRVPLPASPPPFTEATEARLDAEREMGRVLALIARLPARDRDVLALCAWMELSYEDAALALGIPVGTVRSRLSRARGRLRELDAASGHVEGVTSPPAQECLEP